MSTSKNEKPVGIVNAKVVEAYVEAGQHAADEITKQGRALVGKYATAMRKRGRSALSVRDLAASIKAGHEEWGRERRDDAGNVLPAQKDPLGWSPSWAQHVPTVDALMGAEGSTALTLPDLFALAIDLAALAGKAEAMVAITELRKGTAPVGKDGKEYPATVSGLRCATPRKAPRKRSAVPPTGEVNVVDLLDAAVAAWEACVAKDGRISEAMNNALQDALARLGKIEETAHLQA